MTPLSMENLLSDLKSGLVELYGDRLNGMYLFGSYARGEQDDESDLDIMVVLNDYQRYGEEIDRTADLASSLSLNYNVSVSLVFLLTQDWLESATPLLRNVRMDAVRA